MSASLSVHVVPGTCTVACTNHYPGFGSVRTRRGTMICILGAPRLYGDPPTGMADDDVPPNPNSGSGTAASEAVIGALLRASDVRTWGRYLTGHFVLVVDNPLARTCTIITDLGNSFHCYEARSSDGARYFATNLDALAAVSRLDDVDTVSIVEYFTQYSITYPHTYYRGINEVPYASAVTISYHGAPVRNVVSYWLPTCRGDEGVHDARMLAPLLRDGVLHAVEAACAGAQRIGLFLSGGTDSRALAGVLRTLGRTGHAITIAEGADYETTIARRIADACGFTHGLLIRDREYYPRLLDAFIASEGPHDTFTRGGYFGFREGIAQHGFDVVLGGYMSDTLLKLHEANVVGHYFLGRHLGLLEVFDHTDLRDLRGGDRWRMQFAHVFHADLLRAAAERRASITAHWEDLRTDGSAWEWSWMWPFSRNQHNDNLTSHIFHHASFEVFTDRAVVEVARVASQSVKRNGRLFNLAMRPYFSLTRHIPLAQTGIRIGRTTLTHELAVALQHLPPRRWTFHGKDIRALPNFSVLWEQSPLLRAYRSAYTGGGTLERSLFQSSTFRAFDPASYTPLPPRQVRHIMYTLLQLDYWTKYRATSIGTATLCHSQ